MEIDPQEKRRLTELAAELQTLQDLFSKVKGELLLVNDALIWPSEKVRGFEAHSQCKETVTCCDLLMIFCDASF